MNDGARTRTPVKALGSQPSMATISSHPPYTESAVEDIIFPADEADRGIDTGYQLPPESHSEVLLSARTPHKEMSRAHCQD